MFSSLLLGLVIITGSFAVSAALIIAALTFAANRILARRALRGWEALTKGFERRDLQEMSQRFASIEQEHSRH